ncbi:MAG: hypothetical protein E7370_06095 [Clostridiales bacterium]|nr:hypothetical protein [Clostridiales bacterium]
MKVYDFDGIFDKKISDYIAKNPNKKSAEEWEEAIPKLYEKFGKSVIKSLGVSPVQYYKNLTDSQIIKTLENHFNQGISVPQFLTEELEKRNLQQKLLPLLSGNEEQVLYTINLIGSSCFAIEEYFNMLFDNALSCKTKAELCEKIIPCADTVKALALNKLKEGDQTETMLDILSHTRVGDDSVFNALICALRQDRENLSLHATYLLHYGDERAISYLLEILQEEGLGYADFAELKYVVEALGGECNFERDFSLDPQYTLIKGQSEAPSDLFKDIKE